MKTLLSIALLFCLMAFNSNKKDISDYTPILMKPAIQTDTLYEKGKLLFTENCTSCHNINISLRSTGPALVDVTKLRKKEWLYRFIRNSYQMYLDRDPQAVRLVNKNNKVFMTAFTQFTDNDLDAVYHFIAVESENIHKNKH